MKILRIFLIVSGILILVHFLLPIILLHFVNKSLTRIDGYYGQIKDIDVALFRGAYKIESIYLNKVDTASRSQIPFFSSSSIDFSIEWKALFNGEIVGELVFAKPVIRFTKEKVDLKDVRKDSADFRMLLDNLMPLKINRLEIHSGQLQYVDESSKPPVDLNFTNVNLLAVNLRNSYDSSILLPARVTAVANVYEGLFTFNMNFNPLAEEPAFDMNAELKGTNLVLLNDFFQAYAKVDVNKGTLNMYTEVATNEGSFTGYVKPLIKDLDVLGKEDKEDNVFRKLWEGFTGAVSEVFENQPAEQIATKIPLAGKFENPETDMWTTIINILQNAFISAIQPALDNEINIRSVDSPTKEKKNFFQAIFSKKKEKKETPKK